ncbi:DUF6933 domain-containing protein [Roseateles sp. UC29_93]|uniref:DUF6933 domain-containing protein n=1 Tax=Roseateles sp. UC29_93 TaxID=3350177 RepID=UPI0036705F98
MFTFRCTRKLLDRIKVEPKPEPVSPQRILGDWYAHLVHVGQVQIVLAVSERTLLPVVLPAGGTVHRSEVHRGAGTRAGARGGARRRSGRRVRRHAAMGCRQAGASWGRSTTWRISFNSRRPTLQIDRCWSTLSLARTPLKLIEYEVPDRATVAAFAAHRRA